MVYKTYMSSMTSSGSKIFANCIYVIRHESNPNIILYVGKTEKTITERLRAHIAKAHCYAKGNTRKHSRMAVHMIANNYKGYIIEGVESAEGLDKAEASKLEIATIAALHPTLNILSTKFYDVCHCACGGAYKAGGVYNHVKSKMHVAYKNSN